LFIVPGLGATCHTAEAQEQVVGNTQLFGSVGSAGSFSGVHDDGEEFRPSVMAVVSVILFYQLATSDSPSMTVRFAVSA
jgi:hypothetical protein